MSVGLEKTKSHEAVKFAWRELQFRKYLSFSNHKSFDGRGQISK